MAGKTNKVVRVTATRNLDFINEGQVSELERDEQIDKLLAAGYLVEVDGEGRVIDKDVDLGVQAKAQSDAVAPEPVEVANEAEKPARRSRGQ